MAAETKAKKKKLPKGRHKDQIKRYAQSEKKRVRNTSQRSLAKTMVKKVREAVLAKDLTNAPLILQQASRVLQKVASKGVLHKRNISRRISRLAQMVNSLTNPAK